MAKVRFRDTLVGQVVGGRYRIQKRIGAGGMGAVYEARHEKLGRVLALKRLDPRLAEDADALARFRREAEAMSALHHPNVVEIVDWETLDDGSPCIILELLRGESLAERIARKGGLPWPRLARIADEALSALVAAHKHGIVHRDLKPQNIFLARDDAGEERVKLLDFGVSKIRDAPSVTTGDDQLLGTPAFMSPEQARGRAAEAGPESDLWAMGAILHEMATGKPAFHADSVPALLHRICYGEPEALADGRPDAPEAFVAVVRRALTREASARTAAAADMRGELRAALAAVAGAGLAEPMRAEELPESAAAAETATAHAGGNASTITRATGQRARREPARRGWRWPWAVAGGGLLAVGLVLGLWLRPRPRQHAPVQGPAQPPSPSPSVNVAASVPPPAASPSPVAVLAPDAAVASPPAVASTGKRRHGKPDAAVAAAPSPSPSPSESPSPSPSPLPSPSTGKTPPVIFDPFKGQPVGGSP